VRSTENPETGRTGLTWTWVGVVVMAAGAVALFRLDGGTAGIVVGIALAACLGTVAVMLWLDRRAERDTRRLTGRR
jgi:peptidoglycan biosynthesis protein MviN/MurJ (putative lipid II flippase)